MFRASGEAILGTQRYFSKQFTVICFSLRYLDDVVFDFVFDIVFDFVFVFRFLDEGGGGVSYDAREARR